MGPALRPRPPIPPTLPTQSHVSELLDENAALLSAAHTFQKNGKVMEAVEYLRRSQVNIIAMSRILKKQYEQNSQSQGIDSANDESVKVIALKKPLSKRRKKSEVMEAELSSIIVDQNKPLDMPSLS